MKQKQNKNKKKMEKKEKYIYTYMRKTEKKSNENKMQKEHINRIRAILFCFISMWVRRLGFCFQWKKRSPCCSSSSAELGETRRPTQGIRLKSRALRSQTNEQYTAPKNE